MNDQKSSHDLARSAAAALARRPGFRDDLVMEVERRILLGGRDDREPSQMPLGVAEAIALAAFLLSCAEFAWQMWRDTRGTRDTEAIARALRVKVDRPSEISITQRDQVIEVVVAQLPERA